MSTVLETEEHKALRAAVAALGTRYGRDYMTSVIREGSHPNELWSDAAKLGYLGVNLPEEYGGGGGGMAELSIVLEELGAAGSPLLMMVVSPAICGTVIARFGTESQKRQWLPGLADGSLTMAFGITEPDAGSNSHRITTTARRESGEAGSSPAARSSSPASTSRTPPSSSGAPRTRGPARSSPACSSSRATPPASDARRSTWNSTRRRSSSS